MHHRDALNTTMLPSSSAEALQRGASGTALARTARILTSLVPSLTQASLVGSALIVSYGYPLLFGLAVYGRFATATVLTFITQRIVDLIAESTIADRDPFALVKSSLIVSACALALLAGARLFFPAALQAVFDLRLFLALAASTIILNLTFQIGSRMTQFLYAIAFGALNFIVTLIWFALHRNDLPLALTITNVLGFSVGSGLLFLEHRRMASPTDPAQRTSNAVMLGHLPYRVMFAAFQIVAAFGAVLIGSQYLPAEQVGALRLLTTFLLIGYSLSPVNPKMLYVISRTVEGPADLLRVMRPFSPVFAALLLCWLVAVIAIGWTGMSENGRLYLYALSVYPVVLFSAVFERLLLNRRGIRTVGLVVGTFAALTAVALLMGHDLEYYAVVLILCVALYPLVLAIFLSPRFFPIAFLAVLLAGIGALSISGFIIAAAAVAALTTGVAILLPRLLS